MTNALAQLFVLSLELVTLNPHEQQITAGSNVAIMKLLSWDFMDS